MTDHSHYAECSACGWRVEFSDGAMLAGTDPEESAKKRLAGHSSNNDCTADDRDWGRCADERVIEVKASIDGTFHFPLDGFESPHDALKNLTESLDELRHVDDVTVDQTYATERY